MNPPATSANSQSAWRTISFGLLLAAAVGTLGAAFALPWRPQPLPGGAGLARYAPFYTGQSTLHSLFGPDNQPAGLRSQNSTMIPNLTIYTGLSPAVRTVIDQRYFAEGESTVDADQILDRLADVQLGQVIVRNRDADGKVTQQTGLVLREPAGQFLVEFVDPALQFDAVYDPPLLLLPSDLAPGTAWESSGTVSGLFTYTAQNKVEAAGPDCLQVARKFALRRDAATFESAVIDRYCAGVGLVESVTRDGAGNVLERADLVSTDDQSDAIPPREQATLADARPPRVGEEGVIDLADAVVQRFARALPVAVAGEGTFLPTWIGSESPFLLTAASQGPLIAYDPAGAERWRFHTRGTIYGRPAYDPQRDWLFFGGSDKRLYAVDADGLFRWAFQTGDNVAGRPLVADDAVIFGSEDRMLYAVDAASGRLRWQFATGAAVAAGAARAGDLVVVGSDDGVVYALEIDGGELRWRFETGGPVEADIVVADEVAFVASRAGSVIALDVATGDEIWTSQGGAHEGAVLRTAPVVDDSSVYVVDQLGRLTALDRVTGRTRWATAPADSYVGSPALVDGGVVVVEQGGMVDLFSLRGERLRRWNTADARLPDDAEMAFSLGVASGGGALWLIDNAALVYRLGAQVAEHDGYK